MSKPAFSVRIAGLRTEKELTQQQLAETLGLTRGRINNYEQGTREPDHDTLLKIANFFDVSTDYLLGRTDIRTQLTTIALHRDGDPTDDLPPEALRSIEEFKELMRLKYKKKPSE